MPRGGRRKGAGRPALGDKKLLSVEFRIDATALGALDRYARDNDETRSSVLRSLARAFLKRRGYLQTRRGS